MVQRTWAPLSGDEGLQQLDIVHDFDAIATTKRDDVRCVEIAVARAENVSAAADSGVNHRVVVGVVEHHWYTGLGVYDSADVP